MNETDLKVSFLDEKLDKLARFETSAMNSPDAIGENIAMSHRMREEIIEIKLPSLQQAVPLCGKLQC